MDSRDISATRRTRDWIGPAALALAMIAVVGQTLHYRLACGYYDHGIEFLLRFYHVDGAGHYVVKHVLTNSYYPPLYFVALLVVWLLAGTEVLPHVLAGDAMVLGGAWLLYRTLRREEIGCGPAGLAVAGFLLLPGVTVFARTLVIEQPMMLLLPLCIYFLERVRKFDNAAASAGLGAAFGLGMLTKWTFAVYLLVPLAMAFGRLAWEIRVGERGIARRRFAVVGLAALVALAVAGPWYLLVFDPVRMTATAANDPTFAEPLFFRHFLRNLALLRSLTGGPVFWFLAIGWTIAFASRPPARLLLSTLLIPLVPLLLFSLPAHLEDRYLYPLLVYAPFAVTAVDGPGRRRTAAWATSGIFFVLTAAANMGAYGPGGPAFDLGPWKREVPTARLVWKAQHTDRILAAVRADARSAGAASAVVAAHPLFTDHHTAGHAMLYESRRGDVSIPVEVRTYSKFSYGEYAAELAAGRFDYVVVACTARNVCEGDPSGVRLRPDQLLLQPYIDQRNGAVSEPFTAETVREDLARMREWFEPVADVDLGDLDRARVYRRRAP